MRLRLLTRLPLVAALTLPACGSESDAPATTTTTTTTKQPPTWTDPPAAAIAIGQGQTKSTAITLEGEGAVASVVAPAGLEVEISTEPSELAIHAPYTTTGTVAFDVEVASPDGKSTYPVGAEVKPIRWVEHQTWTAQGPEAREHGALIVDEEAGQTILIGGSGYNPQLKPLDDVWRFDIATGAWTKVTPTGDAPAFGGSRRVARIPGQKVAYLFGGYDDTGANLSDLYRVTWDGAGVAFTLLTQSAPPSKRALHAFAYDSKNDRFVMFGGAGNKPLGDTWTMKLDGDTPIWTEITTPTAPSPRYGFFYGVDEASNRLVLFSGAQGFQPLKPANDTWALDMSADPPTWELLVPQGAAGAPPGRRNGCMVLDPTGPRLFVFGGTPDAMTSAPSLWAFDARPGKSAWTELALPDEPTIRSSGIGFYDPTSDRTFLGFGNSTSGVYSDWGIVGY